MKTILLIIGGIVVLVAISILPRGNAREDDLTSFFHNDSAAGDYV